MKNLVKHLKGVLPVALLAVVLGGATVLAQPVEGPDAQGAAGEKGKYAQRIQAAVKEAIKEAIAEELGLTEEQQAQLAEMRKADQAQRKQIMQATHAAQVRLKEELAKYDSDPATLQQVATEVKTLQAQTIDHRIASVTKMKEILTPEQFAKIQEKAKEKRAGFRKGHGGLRGKKDGFGGFGGPRGGFEHGKEDGNREYETP